MTTIAGRDAEICSKCRQPKEKCRYAKATFRFFKMEHLKDQQSLYSPCIITQHKQTKGDIS